MNIEVRLFATLRAGRFKKENRVYDIGSTVQVIIDDLNIPHDDIAIILVNGRDGLMTTQLNDADTLSVFPPVGGG